jgi:hypothetical protein
MKYKVKYAGPKLHIDQHGIFFKEGKEDKYKFLLVAVKILLFLDTGDKNYLTKNITQSDIDNILQKYNKDIETKIQEEEQCFEQYFKTHIEEIKNFTHIPDIDKEVWVKNENIMKDYIFQRNINKIYYQHCIEILKELIKQKHITEITLPFNDEDWHILHSIQGELENGKDRVNTKLEAVIDKNNISSVKLSII